ncbi:MAG TPA: hypothetical protein VHV08_11715, partial [Pirellulales bacterium]|nr:hypothetical protein [Pirellulales bacterium]
MQSFRIALTGDFLDERGRSAYGEMPLEAWRQVPHLEYHFLTGQAPRHGDAAYWASLYSMEVTPEDLDRIDGLVVLRPWVKRPAIAAAAGQLTVIGRSGAGYDKIDVEACTEHGVALFNAPMALNHSTASSALLFMLALAKRLVPQQQVTRAGR